MPKKKIAIIGAGLGGLSAACLLSAKGHDVTVYEKNEGPGGKINEVKAQGFRFDTGPSLLTMPQVLEHLFKTCGASLEDYLKITPVDPICRYFYRDGTVFNCHADSRQTVDEITNFAPKDAYSYREFLDYSEQLYNRTKNAFLFNPLFNIGDLQSLNLTDAFKIDALQTVSQRVDQAFQSAYMRKFFKRFPTYNGSSPYQAPATLNVIPHVELGLGGHYIEGGIYTLVEALVQLGQKLGVTFNYKAEISSILISDGRAAGVKTGNKTVATDAVLSNSDAHETYLNLLPGDAVSFIKKKRLQKIEPSCSGMVLLLGIDKSYDQLSHHNIFFSEDYRKEFRDIFNHRVMPEDPTIYIADTSHTNPEHAIAGGSNLFVLVNAPYLSDSWRWEKQAAQYADFIIDELEERGLPGLRQSIVYKHKITPVDFYEQYRSNKGSIYGTSSNSKMAAFMRPKNKARGIEDLYLTGGSTHPGGGIPLVILSAFHAVELIKRYES